MYATRLRGAMLQCLANPAHDRLELLGGGLAVFAPAEHHIAQAEQAPPDAPGQACTLGDAREVSNQMSPAHLAPCGVDVGISGVTVGHHHTLRRTYSAPPRRSHRRCMATYVFTG